VARLTIHYFITALLAIAGSWGGMILCIGQSGEISIEALCEEQKCSNRSLCTTTATDGNQSDHKCCLDIPLPEAAVSASTQQSTHDHWNSLRPASSLSAQGTLSRVYGDTTRQDTVRSEFPVRLESIQRTIVLLI
jgi:hypothetical protein